MRVVGYETEIVRCSGGVDRQIVAVHGLVTGGGSYEYKPGIGVSGELK